MRLLDPEDEGTTVLRHADNFYQSKRRNFPEELCLL
jgi:hypothetical protein